MKAALLCAIPEGHEPLHALRTVVFGELAAAGYDDVRDFDLARTQELSEK
jgi:hypothetical protein